MAVLFFGFNLLVGALVAAEPPDAAPRRFSRFFVFGALQSEELARKAQACGVTDSSVALDAAQLERARRHGIRAYVGFGPCGPHTQVMAPEELARARFLGGSDIPRTNRVAARLERWRQANYQHGGEPRPHSGAIEVMYEVSQCFIGEAGRAAGRRRLDESVAKLKTMEGESIDGFAFDYIGYANFKGCYHPDCLVLCRRYLEDQGLDDNETNRNAFYLAELVAYNNAMVDHIKGINSEWKVMNHVYPAFLPEPLYGNRLKVDYCGQTVAWYFVWPEERVRRYASVTVGRQHQHFGHVKGVPFVGFGRSAAFDHKTPAILERELKAILESGADSLMLHTFKEAADDPEIVALLMKYCAPEP